MLDWFKKKDKSKVESDDLSSLDNKSWYYNNKNDKKFTDAYRSAIDASRQTINKKAAGYQSSNVWTSITNPTPAGFVITSDNNVEVNLPLVVNGRDIMSEIDEIKAALLIVSRDVELEEKYPELKEAYDNYMEIKRGLGIAEKLYSTGTSDV
jgi:hypothetical protein